MLTTLTISRSSSATISFGVRAGTSTAWEVSASWFLTPANPFPRGASPTYGPCDEDVASLNMNVWNADSPRPRMSMHGGNRLKLGLFGANCSSGRAVTKVPERWSGSWPDNLKLARMADEAGIDFMLPIGRWEGYGGESDR